MREKTDLLTDDELGWPSLPVGNDPLTGLPMFRRFKRLTSDAHDSCHEIQYEEWCVALDGKVYDEFYRLKSYKVVDISDPIVASKYTDWVDQLKPVLGPAINNTLQNTIPKLADSGFVI